MANEKAHHWPWWPLLPLYPYGKRHTIRRELLPGQLWALEQLQGVFYVAVPIRMLVLKLQEGLLLYAPVAATAACIALIKQLEHEHGPVRTIVHPSSSGLEHKVGVPAMARAFPEAQLWVTPGQWSFPLPLPLPWLGFPEGRTRVLFKDGLPHQDQLTWLSLGPVPLGPGPFHEACCLHKATGALLVTDALISVSDQWPSLLDQDPRPLLFHGRESGAEAMLDSPQMRLKGWRRLVLFACYLRPAAVSQVLRMFPFRWQESWEDDFEILSKAGALQVAPILEELVFPRHRKLMADWLMNCSLLPVRWVIPAHFNAPVPVDNETFKLLYKRWIAGRTDSEKANRILMRNINKQLEKLKLVPLN